MFQCSTQIFSIVLFVHHFAEEYLASLQKLSYTCFSWIGRLVKTCRIFLCSKQVTFSLYVVEKGIQMSDACVRSVPCMTRGKGDELHAVSILAKSCAQLLQHFVGVVPISRGRQRVSVASRHQRLPLAKWVAVFAQHLSKKTYSSFATLLCPRLACFFSLISCIEEEIKVLL